MILEVFGIFVLLSIALIFLGFHVNVMAYSLIGFLFLFLVSFTLINSSLQYETGATVTDVAGVQTVEYQYTTFTDNSHYYGYYLAVASGIGMAVTLASGTRWGRRLSGGAYED